MRRRSIISLPWADRFGQTKLYTPWSIFTWTERWAETYPKPFAIARLIVFAGFILAFLIAALALQRRLQLKPFGKDAWAKFTDLEAAGLFGDTGAILGKFDVEIIAYDGPDHQLLIGASRSGKGRGHVVPTLLTWNGSALVLDVKGELDRGDPRHGFSRQCTGNPRDFSSGCSHGLSEPASWPTRRKPPANGFSTAAIEGGSDGTLISRATSPLSSITHTAVSATATSSPQKYSRMLRSLAPAAESAG